MLSPSPNLKTFYKGQTIFKEGQESNVAYLIRKGTVLICKVVNNKRIILDRLREGEVFGEMGVIAKAPRTAEAEAAEYCELTVLTEQMMDNLLAQCPKTIQHLTRLLVRRLQKTDALLPEGDAKSTFLSVCRILEMCCRLHQATPPAEARKNPNHQMGVLYSKVSKTIKDIILVSQLEIDNILEKLHRLRILSFQSVKSSRAFSERYLTLSDPENFLAVTESLYKELQRHDYTATTEMAYVDIYELAEYVESEPEMLYRKIGSGEFPETLFFFNKAHAFGWADQKGKDFFRRVRRVRKPVEQFEDVNDVVHMDGPTLKEALQRLGYYKIGVLLGAAGEEARDKLRSCLSKKIAAVVEEEAGRRRVDQVEAQDVQDELLSLLKELKGVSA